MRSRSLPSPISHPPPLALDAISYNSKLFIQFFPYPADFAASRYGNKNDKYIIRRNKTGIDRR